MSNCVHHVIQRRDDQAWIFRSEDLLIQLERAEVAHPAIVDTPQIERGHTARVFGGDIVARGGIQRRVQAASALKRDGLDRPAIVGEGARLEHIRHRDAGLLG